MVRKNLVVFFGMVLSLVLFLSCGGKGGGSGVTSQASWKGIQQLGVAGKLTGGTGIITDSSGSIFVMGATEGGLDGNTLTGIYDFFVTKYNSSGVKQWTRQFGEPERETRSEGITLDSYGNVYVLSSGNLTNLISRKGLTIFISLSSTHQELSNG